MVKISLFIFFLTFIFFNNYITCQDTIVKNIKKLLKEDILKKLLYELDLPVLPNITRNNFESFNEEYYFDGKEEASRSKTFYGTSLSVGNVIGKTIHFKIPILGYDKIIKKGKLIIPLLTINLEYDIIDLKILHLFINETYNEIIGSRRYTFEEIIKANEIEIPIYNDQIDNLISVYKEFDLEVLATLYNFNENNHLLSSKEITLELDYHSPYITYTFFPKYQKRIVRSEYETCDGTLNSGSCCLQNFQFDFSKPPWNFIVAPSHLNIKRCIGSCIFNDYSTSNSHFIRYLEDSEHKSCCYASEYEIVKVLYTDDNLGTLKSKNITNLIAKACRCY